MNPQYSIWLLPDAAHEPRLTRTVAELSAVQGESAFMPHVTIQGDLSRSLETLTELIDRLAQEVSVQRWRIRAVECSDQFFRCLYLRFALDASFVTLQTQTLATTGTPEGLSPFPHLSLAYGRATDATRRLRDELSGTFAASEVVFDRIALVHSSKDVPIAEWRVLELRTLAGCRNEPGENDPAAS